MPALEETASLLVKEFDLHPVMGLELEWYVRPQGHAAPYEPAAQERDSYLDALCLAADAAGVRVDSFDEEHGPGQFEAALSHSSDLPRLLRQMAVVRELIQDTGWRRGYVTDFSPKPYPALYGNGLHVHVHLENAQGKNVFRKNEKTLSPELEAAMAGLLADLPRAMRVFAPHTESWARFEAGWNAPVKACWGTNNRTTALRLPDGTAQIKGADALARLKNPDARRIEHRVAGSDAHAGDVMTAILQGILLGLRERPALSAPVYGDAGDAQYEYPLILNLAS